MSAMEYNTTESGNIELTLMGVMSLDKLLTSAIDEETKYDTETVERLRERLWQDEGGGGDTVMFYYESNKERQTLIKIIENAKTNSYNETLVRDVVTRLKNLPSPDTKTPKKSC